MSRITPERWKEVSPYLDEVLTLSGQQRVDWLARFRENDPELALLLDEFLEEQRSLSEDSFLENCPPLPPLQSASAGEIIGPYRLLAPIGYGGMGTVWLAERSDGRFERKVAIKFPYIALAGQSGQERFRREGSILGRLSHPHIADLVDAGVSRNGQPYLVLEYIDGEPIDQYCNHHGLELEARIRLFLDVLSAVAHAHTNLIVHRDIKPSNVLVAADGNIKLLDFGIAKLLEEHGQAREATLLTQEGGPALTPEYAAPEQITGNPITTSTDVYSLGVLLYVLLTGQHPAGPGRHSPADLVKAIVETDPAPLSQMASCSVASGTKPSTALLRLRRELRGDLDTIVANALKKDPSERYHSVTALAQDLQRYLKHEPISARPDTIAYRTRKFVRRNRVAVALTTVALIALIAGATGTLIQARTARRQRDAAIRERDRAKRITDFTVGIFKVSDPTEKVGNAVTAREVLDKASNDIEKSLAKDPELQAQMMRVMGNAYSNLGLQQRAKSLFERSIKISSSAGGPENREALATMTDLGWALFQQGNLTGAERLERKVLGAQRRLFGREDPDTLQTLSQLATIVTEEGMLPEAERLGREVVEIRKRVLGPEASPTLGAMDNLAVYLANEGKLAEAEKLERDTLASHMRVSGLESLGAISCMVNLADFERDLGRIEQAQGLFRQALAVEGRVLGIDQPETAETRHDLACLVARTGKRDEALSLLRQAVDHGLEPRVDLGIENEPCFSSLSHDPRFRALVAHAKQRAAARKLD